jgi:hypothetical protein
MNEILRQFYNTEAMRETVKAFMIEVLKERAVDKVFNKKAIAGVYEARQTIDDAFDKLEELYGVKDKPVITNSK